MKDARDLVVGLEKEVPLLDGTKRRYINLDNAATTPPFKEVLNTINEFAGWYSSVHRGTGYKSLLSTKLYNHCRDIVAQFIGADPSFHTVIFCNNTTDAINKICHSLNLKKDEVVLTTLMEHHSNQLPWRFCGAVDYVELNDDDGTLNLNSLRAKLEEYKGRVRLVAVTGASNITGIINPIHDIGTLAHQYGALFLVDMAQLIAHRPVQMGHASDPGHIDFMAFSAHKMYAPFGCGVLVGPREFFNEGRPAMVGGGTVELVTMKEIVWSEAPEKEEAGSPNLFGALALAKAIQALQRLGMEKVAAHERDLTSKTLRLLREIPGITIYGDNDPDLKQDRVGVIPILAEGYGHGLLAAILSYEWGIGVRHGCFCAHSYVSHLFDLSQEDLDKYLDRVRKGDRTDLPGLVRISFGIYNTLEEIEYLAHAFREILKNGSRFKYSLNKTEGEYYPEGSSDKIDLSFLI